MMDLIKQQETLKGLPDDRLMQEMQQGTGMFDPFMVTSEMNKRKELRDSVQAEQAEVPTTTVREDLMVGIMSPQTRSSQGATGGVPLPTSPSPQQGSPVEAGIMQKFQDGGSVFGPDRLEVLRQLQQQFGGTGFEPNTIGTPPPPSAVTPGIASRRKGGRPVMAQAPVTPRPKPQLDAATATAAQLAGSNTGIAAPRMPTYQAPPAGAPATDRLSGIEALIAQREGRTAQDAERNKWLAIMNAGLGIMGGQSPNALTNIAAGAKQGLEAYTQGEADIAANRDKNLALRTDLELARMEEEQRVANLARQAAATQFDADVALYKLGLDERELDLAEKKLLADTSRGGLTSTQRDALAKDVTKYVEKIVGELDTASSPMLREMLPGTNVTVGQALASEDKKLRDTARERVRMDYIMGLAKNGHSGVVELYGPEMVEYMTTSQAAQDRPRTTERTSLTK